MEVTALCFRLVMLKLILLRGRVHNQKTTFLRITPNRLQHFQFNSVSFDCVGFVGRTRLKAVRNTKELNLTCDSRRTTSSCVINRVNSEDSGEYWCESEGERSNRVNITITAGPVILDIPARPVMQGTNVILRCSSKNQSTNLGIFYKNNVLMHSSPADKMEINNVSKSHEGFYRCYVSSLGTSPASWLAVRVHEETVLDDYDSKFPNIRILLRLAVTSVVMSLLMVGCLFFKKHKVSLDAQTVESIPGKENQLVGGEDGADDPDRVTYAVVVTKQKKQTDTADADDNLSLCCVSNQRRNPQTENDDDEDSHEPLYADVTIISRPKKSSFTLTPNPTADEDIRAGNN